MQTLTGTTSGRPATETLRLKNNSGVVVPPRSLLEITDSTLGVLQAVKPTGASKNQIIVTDDFQIPVGATVEIRNYWPKQVAVAEAVAAGDTLGTQTNSFIAKKGNSGLVSYSIASGSGAGSVSVRPFSSGALTEKTITNLQGNYLNSYSAVSPGYTEHIIPTSTVVSAEMSFPITITNPFAVLTIRNVEIHFTYMVSLAAQVTGYGLGQALFELWLSLKDTSGNWIECLYPWSHILRLKQPSYNPVTDKFRDVRTEYFFNWSGGASGGIAVPATMMAGAYTDLRFRTTIGAATYVQSDINTTLYSETGIYFGPETFSGFIY